MCRFTSTPTLDASNAEVHMYKSSVVGRGLFKALLPLTLLFLTACFSLPSNSDIETYKQIPAEQDDAGYAGASIVAVMPLASVTASFTQSATLTYDQALAAVQSYARAKQQAGRDSFQLGLEVGLTRKTPSGTRTVSSDTPHGTATTTNINQSVTVVTSAGQPASVTLNLFSPTAVTTASFAANTVTINPAIAHQAADQLIKLTSMMRMQYNSIPHSKEEDVYIVQIKAGLQPYKPLLPLDAYLHLTLLPDLSEAFGTNTSTLANPPRLVPLAFGSEEYEFSSSGVSEEYLRGLALGLNASSTWGGLNFGMQQMLSSLTQVNATDVNGLIVSVPFSPNSVQIRLGAMWQGSAERAMIPRNFNGFFAMIVPKDSGSNKYSLLSKTYFRKPSDGKALIGTRGSEIVSDIKYEFCTYNLALRKGCALDPSTAHTTSTETQTITAAEDWFAFLNSVRRNDLRVLQCVQLTEKYQTAPLGSKDKKADCQDIAKKSSDGLLLDTVKTLNVVTPTALLEKFIVSLNKIALKDRVSYSVVLLPDKPSKPSGNKK
jgi:hypothetical protein